MQQLAYFFLGEGPGHGDLLGQPQLFNFLAKLLIKLAVPAQGQREIYASLSQDGDSAQEFAKTLLGYKTAHSRDTQRTCG